MLEIKFNKIDAKSEFDKNEIRISFNVDNKELNTLIFLDNVNTIQLEESNLTIKNYKGEY